MKVVWLCPYDATTLEPPLKLARHSTGHSCSWIVTLSQELAGYDDLELHIVSESPLVQRDSVVEHEGIFFHVLKSGIPFIHRGYPQYFNVDIYTRFFFNIRRLNKEVQRIRPDIVHAYGTENTYSLTAAASGFPYMITMQGIINLIEADSNSSSNEILKELERQVVSKTKFFDCRTQLDKGFVKKHSPDARIFHIDHAIHPDFFSGEWELAEKHRLLFVGSVIERKGIEVLLAAMSNLIKEFPDMTLSVIGGVSTEYHRHLEEIIQENGLNSAITFLGFLPQEEVAAAHRNHQILAYPSFAENSPNGVAEAMVSGLPVIVSAVGGVPSMIEDGKTGLLIKPENVESLTVALRELLKNPVRRKELSRNAMATARSRHSPSVVAKKVIAAYSEILGDKMAKVKNKDQHAFIN